MICAAIGYAVDKNLKLLNEQGGVLTRRAALEKYIDNYLSPEHVNNIKEGCAIAALATDVGKLTNAIKSLLSEQAERVVAKIALAIDGERIEAHRKANALFAHLVGAITLARIAGTPKQMSEILLSARETIQHILK